MRISQVLKAGWPLLLCAASAGVTLAWVRVSDSNREKQMGKITIEHIHVETEKPFGEVTAALEARMGKFDPGVYEQLRNGDDPDAVGRGAAIQLRHRRRSRAAGRSGHQCGGGGHHALGRMAAKREALESCGACRRPSVLAYLGLHEFRQQRE